MKIDIIEFYKASSQQDEYKNPADFIKHKLDAKYGPYWFVFMWEDMPHQHAQYSYYNNDDRVLEFKLNGWHILIYSFNQSRSTSDAPSQVPPSQTIHTTGPHVPQFYQ